MTASPNGALVRRAIAAIWNRGELALADALFAPDYVNHGGLIPDLVRGPEAIKVSVVLYRAAFPGLQLSVEDLLVQGEMVAVRWLARRPRPPAAARPGAPGAAAPLMGMTFGRCVAGQIAESWTCWQAPAP